MRKVCSKFPTPKSFFLIQIRDGKLVRVKFELETCLFAHKCHSVSCVQRLYVMFTTAFRPQSVLLSPCDQALHETLDKVNK